jgi:hypothetical protein
MSRISCFYQGQLIGQYQDLTSKDFEVWPVGSYIYMHSINQWFLWGSVMQAMTPREIPKDIQMLAILT